MGVRWPPGPAAGRKGTRKMGKLSKAQEDAVRWMNDRRHQGVIVNPPVNGRTLACLERDGYVVRVWTSARGEGWQATDKAVTWIEERDAAAKQQQDEAASVPTCGLCVGVCSCVRVNPVAEKVRARTLAELARDGYVVVSASEHPTDTTGTGPVETSVRGCEERDRAARERYRREVAPALPGAPQAFIPNEAAESIHTYRGVRFLVTITPDPYTMPEDYGVALESILAPWRRGEWRYVSVTVSPASMRDLSARIDGISWGTMPDCAPIGLSTVVRDNLPVLATAVMMGLMDRAAWMSDAMAAWESHDA